MATTIDRRDFLKVGAAAGGGLLLGFSLFGCKGSDKHQPAATTGLDSTKAPTGEPEDLNAWVRIDPDGTVTLTVAESEMGQGVLTALPMILAEELDADWSKVRSVHAPADEAKYGFQLTGGSGAVRKGFEPLRKAGAAARHMLVAAAAQTWEVDAGECRTEQGVVIHDKSGKRAGYGELVGKAATLEAPAAPALKDKKNFRIIGQPVKRLDAPDKIRGKATFGIDVKVPGMLVAQVARSPIFGGKVKSFDATAAKAVPGVREVVQISTGVSVVADHYWAAKKGRDALVIEWDDGGNGALTSAGISEILRKAVTTGKEARKVGDAAATIKSAKKKLEAVYEVPFLAHAPMEPLNCTADVRADGCEIWAPHQSPSIMSKITAKVTGLGPDKIKVNTTMLGGGFGRRAHFDFLTDAIESSKAVGKPVKAVWTREDDIRAGSYRPVAYNQMLGSLDAEGWPSAWIHRIASPGIMKAVAAVMGMPVPEIDPTSIEGAENVPYSFAHLHVTCADPPIPVPVWFWRSVGSSQNAYVTECFFDELAALGGKDPVEARLRMLDKHPRHKRVLERAAEKAGWGSALPEGMARGVAVHESFGSIVAQVAEVSIDKKAVKVHRVVCAVDCGEFVNPNIINAQMEGAIAFGLSAALYGKIEIEKGRAVQSNFHDYPLVRMNEMPRVETHIIAEGDPMGGIGEPGTPPIAPAVCNAVRVLTGKPVRSLPIRLA